MDDGLTSWRVCRIVTAQLTCWQALGTTRWTRSCPCISIGSSWMPLIYYEMFTSSVSLLMRRDTRIRASIKYTLCWHTLYRVIVRKRWNAKHRKGTTYVMPAALTWKYDGPRANLRTWFLATLLDVRTLRQNSAILSGWSERGRLIKRFDSWRACCQSSAVDSRHLYPKFILNRFFTLAL